MLQPPSDASATHQPATCPRCGGAFHCGAHDAHPCACTRIALDAATLAALRARWAGCLCLECLVALQREAGADAGGTMPAWPTTPR